MATAKLKHQNAVGDSRALISIRNIFAGAKITSSIIQVDLCTLARVGVFQSTPEKAGRCV
jgi:hypothetical protein